MIARKYAGWSLADLKSMTTRERKYWISFIAWEENRAKIMMPKE